MFSLNFSLSPSSPCVWALNVFHTGSLSVGETRPLFGFLCVFRVSPETVLSFSFFRVFLDIQTLVSFLEEKGREGGRGRRRESKKKILCKICSSWRELHFFALGWDVKKIDRKMEKEREGVRVYVAYAHFT